jgi:hypothetical protein
MHEYIYTPQTRAARQQPYHFCLVDLPELGSGKLAYRHIRRPHWLSLPPVGQRPGNSLRSLVYPSIALAHDEYLEVRRHECGLGSLERVYDGELQVHSDLVEERPGVAVGRSVWKVIDPARNSANKEDCNVPVCCKKECASVFRV